MKRFALILAVLAICASAGRPAFAQEPSVEPGVRFRAIAGAESTLTADNDPAIRPSAEIEIDGPLPLGQGLPARVFTRFRTYGMPGETVDLTDVKTFRAAELSVGAYRRVGRVTLGTQEVWTSLEAEYGFATAMPADGHAAALRSPRHYGIGTRLEERKSGAWLSFLYGREESAGPRQWGQWIISAAAPLSGTKGTFVLGGDAVLSVGPPSQQQIAGQRDLVRLYVAVSLPDVANAFR